MTGDVSDLPPRGEYLITGGHVVTMDRAIGDVPAGWVHVRDGQIVAVGTDVDAPAAERIDATNCVVLPGFVDTHWHMWNSLWRGLSHDAVGYFGLHSLAAEYTLEDHYVAVQYAAAEAINAGFTTCHNWAHGIRGPADAEAEMKALADSGLRAHFGYGDSPPGGDRAVGRAELEAAAAWCARYGDGRLTLGLAAHNPTAFPEEVALARELGLATIAPHLDFSDRLDLVGADFLYTHGAGDPPQMLSLVAASGMKVGLCPWTDPLVGAGLSPLEELLSSGVDPANIGLSVDVSCQTSADPFSAMRMLLYSARIAQRPGMSFVDIVRQDGFGTGQPAPLMHPRDVLDIGTINGARVLGLGDITGSLSPGKRADVVLVRTDDLNMMPLSADADVAALVVQCGQPANVDTVLIDGRIVKRNRELVSLSTADVVVRAFAAQRALLDRSRARQRVG